MSKSEANPWSAQRGSVLNAVIQLKNVELTHLAAKPLPHVDITEPRFNCSVNFDPVMWDTTDTGLNALYALNVEIQHLGEPVVPLVSFRLGVRNTYLKTAPIPDEHWAFVPDYLGIAGWLHAWPYFRADVHSLSTRMGFPPLLLPVLRAGHTANIDVVRLSTPAPAADQAKGVKRKLPPAKKGPGAGKRKR